MPHVLQRTARKRSLTIEHAVPVCHSAGATCHWGGLPEMGDTLDLTNNVCPNNAYLQND